MTVFGPVAAVERARQDTPLLEDHDVKFAVLLILAPALVGCSNETDKTAVIAPRAFDLAPDRKLCEASVEAKVSHPENLTVLQFEPVEVDLDPSGRFNQYPGKFLRRYVMRYRYPLRFGFTKYPKGYCDVQEIHRAKSCFCVN